jgi:hypothetical protein
MPSVVSRTCEPKPTGRMHAYFLSSARNRVSIRLLSTRAPRQAVLRASFRLAPCHVLRHEALRPPGGQDARCVRSTSATRTNCVHPHLMRSRLHCRGFRRVGASRSLGSERLDRGTEHFHGARFASADRRGHTRNSCVTWPRARQVVGLPRRRAWAFSSHGALERSSL